MFYPEHIGIIIQARTGSTRLPGKMTLPFYRDQSLISLMISKFRQQAGNIPFVIATTRSSGDDIIAEICKKSEVPCFRGSENDVLNRFINAAEKYKFENIIRVCADNPFFDIASTLMLAKLLKANEADYAGFLMNGNLPSIKTHIGLWGEAVSYNALLKAASLTSNLLYREHVTNYIYSHPQTFKISLAPAPSGLSARTDLRFTLDTREDYELHRDIYNQLAANDKTEDLTELIGLVDQNTEFQQVMQNQISLNSK